MTKTSLDLLVSGAIAPLLKKNEFRKKGLDFYKTTQDLVFDVNIQKGKVQQQAYFYINIGIYSPELDRTIGIAENGQPKEFECHFRRRIADLINAGQDRYMADTTTAAQITTDLDLAMDVLDKIRSANDLVKLMCERGGLENYEKLVSYLALTDNHTLLKTYIDALKKLLGDDKRWPFFEGKMNEILKSHGKEYGIFSIPFS
ncbi:DUF4304 domain-containing protein [Chitinophaga arvensicola]|uniref:DUF4304 domain-containing protein n=1 Tax=Chitinophaga arvensicola TaxID=29529 RepID=A0A1I0SAC4_9BACT|nr:DUF4304 domain-containing protein [Chitinophaga arvensicola]SEW53444.1 protein of unknown function [Chitinophaga arvensicola]